MVITMRRVSSSGSPLEDVIGFSRACRVGDIIAVSGTAPLSDAGETLYQGDLYKQTQRCLEISLKSIEDIGGSIKGVIRTRIMLTNIRDWELAAKAHGELFSRIKPACTFVEVNGFINPEWLVETEMDCVASLG